MYVLWNFAPRWGHGLGAESLLRLLNLDACLSATRDSVTIINSSLLDMCETKCGNEEQRFRVAACLRPECAQITT